MATTKVRRSITLQIDNKVLGPAIDRILAHARARYDNDPIATDGLDDDTMYLIRAAMSEAIVALDDLLLSEDPKKKTEVRGVLLSPSRPRSFSETRFGFRKAYGASRGDFDRFRNSGPVGREHFLEQAEARMGQTLTMPSLAFRAPPDEG